MAYDDQSDVVEGWLKKRGRINSAFKQRWMVLQGGQLCYFAGSAGRMELKGTIQLCGGRVDLCRSGSWRINLTEHGVDVQSLAAHFRHDVPAIRT